MIGNNNNQINQTNSTNPTQIPIPFLQQSTYLGDIIANIISFFSIVDGYAKDGVPSAPCSPCEARKRILNDKVVFVPFSK